MDKTQTVIEAYYLQPLTFWENVWAIIAIILIFGIFALFLAAAGTLSNRR